MQFIVGCDHVAFQDCPNELLPAALQNENPLGILRTIDGKLTTDAMKQTERIVFDCIDGNTAGNPVRLVKVTSPNLNGMDMGEREFILSKNTTGFEPP